MNLKSAILATDRWYEIETCHGANIALGLLYHVWKPASILDSPRADRTKRDGSTFLMTFFQPGALDDKAFDEAATELHTELATLREILERGNRSIQVSPNL